MSQLKDRRTSMRVTAENIVLNSGEWFTQNELNSIATCQQFELDEWELSGKIFSIHHDGTDYYPTYALDSKGHCCKVSDEAAFCLIQRPYISKTLLTRRISPRGSP
ncbi:hypothetical protein [Salmonella sp. CQ22WZ0207SAL]|uniref:hypothetical protein n=1 Tax=Salmonella sp. CQ22WZ0207SAL TaxID=3417678 RepID=UPI003D36A1DD